MGQFFSSQPIFLITNTAAGFTLAATSSIGPDPRRFYRVCRLP
jgi:hypothetical protein